RNHQVERLGRRIQEQVRRLKLGGQAECFRDFLSTFHGDWIEVNSRDLAAAMVADRIGEPTRPAPYIQYRSLGLEQGSKNGIRQTRIPGSNGLGTACNGFAKVERQCSVKRQHFRIGKSHDVSLAALMLTKECKLHPGYPAPARPMPCRSRQRAVVAAYTGERCCAAIG